MRCQTLRRNLNPARQTRFDHPPANRPLQSAQSQNSQQTISQRAGECAFEPEPDKRQGKGKPDHSAQQPVSPFPEEDELEARQIHIREELRILRDLLVSLELPQPIGLSQRRQYAGDQFPFGDRQARFRQSRRTAHQHHQKHEASDRP